MTSLEQIYQESEAHAQRVWQTFPYLHPNFRFLKREIGNAVRDGDRTFPLDSLHFRLFPDEESWEFQERFRRCMNRGIQAVNSLGEEHLEEKIRDVIRLPEVSRPLDLYEFVKEAHNRWEKGTERVQRVDHHLRLQAYQTMQSLELGYKVGMIDQSPEVVSATEHFEEVIGRVVDLLNPTNQRPADVTGVKDSSVKDSSIWDSAAGTAIYSRGSEGIIIPARLKYLDAKNERNYSSILMKIYRKLQFPDEITDYIGTELIVADDEASGKLLSFFRRKTSPEGTTEGYEDTTQRRLSEASSNAFGVKKFILRIPARTNPPKLLNATESVKLADPYYETIPIEVQILTLEQARIRETLPEATHHEYKQRQYLQIFPTLFPREIYGPLFQAKGLL